uniref:Uncharacterized protein n=1 Tax=Poecilia latipinna TaxID=48699 RepID=A0A3B3U893_9TELE
MLSRIFFACIFLSLFCACSPLSCRWMEHKFRQYRASVRHLQNQKLIFIFDYLHAEGKLAFTVQVLKEVSALFKEDDGSSPWQEVTMEHFLNVVNKQADELQLCVSTIHLRPNRRLHVYFKRLSNSVFGQMGHSAEAWELIRREIKLHLIRADHLVSSLFVSN